MPILAQYPFSEGAGFVAHDTTGNGSDLTLANATWTAGHTDNALYIGDSVTDPAASGPIPANPGGAWTVMGWFSALDSTDPLSLLTIVNDGGLRAEILAAPPSNHTYVRIYDEQSGQWYAGDNDPPTDWSAPVHVAFTIEPGPSSGGTLTIYVNGAATSPYVSTASVALTDWGTLHLGGARFASPASGYVDDLRIFDEALSAGDITTYMNMPVPPYEEGAVTNNVRIGGKQPSAFYVGDRPVKAIRLGATLVYG